MPQAERARIAKKLLAALFAIGYDFMRPSGASKKTLDDLNTLEMMLTTSIDPYYFDKILTVLWSSQDTNQKNSISAII